MHSGMALGTLHGLAHAPQFLTSLPSEVSQLPLLSQSANPMRQPLELHIPLVHAGTLFMAGQAMPHAPQLAISMRVSAQCPPQQLPPWQLWPQAPQSLAEVKTSVQV